MSETPQQVAETLFTQYVVARQTEPGYADFLRALRLRLDQELARTYAAGGCPPHRLFREGEGPS